MLEILGKLGLGLLIGTICGAVPLVIGLLTERKAFGIIGIVCTALSGVLFSLLDKSPFTAAVVAILFILFIIIGNKKVASVEKNINAEAISNEKITNDPSDKEGSQKNDENGTEN